MLRTLRLPALLAALSLPLALAACNTGTKTGDTNVELSASKKRQPNNTPPANANGDSLAAGISPDTAKRPTGKQIYKNTDHAVDRNHDGLAD